MDSTVSRAGFLFGLLIFALLNAVCVPIVVADESAWDRFSLTVSGYKPSIDTEVRLDASNQTAGTDLDLEDDLKLDDSDALTQYYASLRLTRSVSAEGSYFTLGRSAQTQLTGSIQFGDTIFPVNVDVTTAFEADVATLGLRWAFFHSERAEFAMSAGAYWMSLKAGIQSTGAALNEIAEADSPLPMAGLSVAWNLTPGIQLTANGDYLPIDYDDFDGSIANYRVGLRYRILEHVGIGIGYDVLDVDVDSKSSSFAGFVKYRQQGPKAFLTLRF